jgi:hypothetical protein
MTVRELTADAITLNRGVMGAPCRRTRTKLYPRWQVNPGGRTRGLSDDDPDVDGASRRCDREYLRVGGGPLPRFLHGWHGITR